MLSGIRRTRTAPSSYPRIPFHGLRVAQFLASAVVGAVMCYFIWHLKHEGWSVPWTFIIVGFPLITVSILSVLALIFTFFMHILTGLHPRLNLFINTVLLILWGLGFGLLAWWSSGTLRDACDVKHWHDGTGMMVCRVYKALFAFSLLGVVSTVLSALLDVHVFRRMTARGKYNQMPSGVAASGGKRGIPMFGTPAGGRNSYAVPEGQFDYDTGYHGAGGRQH
ncbi:hypothetical protein BDY21DRAFT_328532 [Lineolata rhizophorae]|uniref:MARVEL domain-containing protein n=1 Tax=Lineolata rhizophorae TaxID=578093 RepID=A0A6A6NNG2_9PEZI|nr:hypothetical protein BDY21DRAFT_328532 [Lineolata rhizophorae]